jgi:hypothetical protein
LRIVFCCLTEGLHTWLLASQMSVFARLHCN